MLKQGKYAHNASHDNPALYDIPMSQKDQDEGFIRCPLPGCYYQRIRPVTIRKHIQSYHNLSKESEYMQAIPEMRKSKKRSRQQVESGSDTETDDEVLFSAEEEVDSKDEEEEDQIKDEGKEEKEAGNAVVKPNIDLAPYEVSRAANIAGNAKVMASMGLAQAPLMCGGADRAVPSRKRKQKAPPDLPARQHPQRIRNPPQSLAHEQANERGVTALAVGGVAFQVLRGHEAGGTEEPVKKEVREEKQGKAGKQAEEELKVKGQDEASDTEEEDASDLSEQGIVEDIFAEKTLTEVCSCHNQPLRYEVKWEGLASNENTWEPRCHLLFPDGQPFHSLKKWDTEKAKKEKEQSLSYVEK
jgi:hypothetical protein